MGSCEYDKLPALAADLVSRNVAVIVAVGGDVSARAAQQATSAFPIVFGAASDAVKAGLVKSLISEGNATGFTLLTNDLEPKRLGLLHDLLPKADIIGVLYDPNFPPAVISWRRLRKPQRQSGYDLRAQRGQRP